MTAGGRVYQDRVVVVGSGWLFASGISHYTYRLSSAFAEEYPVGVLLMRRLLPRRLYPGRKHVGVPVTNAAYPANVEVYDGVDWYWGTSLTHALRYLDRQRPTVLVLQWWTRCRLAHVPAVGQGMRRGVAPGSSSSGTSGQDVGEAALPGRSPLRRGAHAPPATPSGRPRSALQATTCTAISGRLSARATRMVRVMPHGPYDHLVRPEGADRPMPGVGSPFRLLYLGVVRPFKGVEDSGGRVQPRSSVIRRADSGCR